MLECYRWRRGPPVRRFPPPSRETIEHPNPDPKKQTALRCRGGEVWRRLAMDFARSAQSQRVSAQGTLQKSTANPRNNSRARKADATSFLREPSEWKQMDAHNLPVLEAMGGGGAPEPRGRDVMARLRRAPNGH